MQLDNVLLKLFAKVIRFLNLSRFVNFFFLFILNLRPYLHLPCVSSFLKFYNFNSCTELSVLVMVQFIILITLFLWITIILSFLFLLFWSFFKSYLVFFFMSSTKNVDRSFTVIVCREIVKNLFQNWNIPKYEWFE